MVKYLAELKKLLAPFHSFIVRRRVENSAEDTKLQEVSDETIYSRMLEQQSIEKQIVGLPPPPPFF